jgi:hypothetical protein
MLVIAVMTIVSVVNLLGFTTMLYSRGIGNLPGEPNSIASSLLYCCPEEIRSNPRSECDNTIPCVAPFPTRIEELSHNTAHTVMFGCAGGFFLLDLASLGLTVLATLWTFFGIGNTRIAKQYALATKQFTQVLDDEDKTIVPIGARVATPSRSVRIATTNAKSRRPN